MKKIFALKNVVIVLKIKKIVLEVHHIDENRNNNDISNLVILCPICHKYLTLHLYTLEQLLKQNGA